ncbi:hypothetical protein Patl1_09002 [Pistacia atlantica]|uniref:Uncharacterized protein n=1 Tax=Pistacia atlantica TaxID=434234 RepID=A0ACC1AH56_9ROSI|nr:hypothetical protein Patl1_09002 [Pistacia atlantica]
MLFVLAVECVGCNSVLFLQFNGVYDLRYQWGVNQFVLAVVLMVFCDLQYQWGVTQFCSCRISGVKQNQSLDALLSDICIATSAAPTYLPAHYFETKDSAGKVRDFILIDGGVAQITPGSPDFLPIKPMDYERFLVISLGTGSAKKGKYSAEEAAKWGVLGWLTSGGSTPLVDVFTQASADMVDLHISVVFQALHSEKNYLRIQDDKLNGVVSSVDIATKNNLEDLVKVGENLLKKPVSRVNVESDIFQPFNNGETNEEALIRFAKLLSDEKRLRQARSPSPNGRAANSN